MSMDVSWVPNVISASAGLLGVVLGAAATHFREEIKEQRQRDRELKYLTIRVVSSLDQLVRECLLVARDDGTDYGMPVSQDGMRAPTTKTPAFNPLSLDVTWKVLKPSLLYEILSLPPEIQAIDEQLLEFSNFDSSHDRRDTLQERQRLYAEFGLKVFDLADRIRAHADFRKLDLLEGQPNPADELLEIKTTIEKELTGEVS